MDSQADSLDIPKLKRFALGLPETDVSQAFLSEPDSQSSSLIPEKQQTPGKESAIHQAVSRSASSASLLAVHVFPASNQDVRVASQSDTQLQPILKNLSTSNRSKMSSGDTGPGDTQPISQSVYDGIMSRSKVLSMTQDGSQVDIGMHDTETGTLHMTFKEGDPGHTDLLAGFGDSNPSEHHDNSDNEPSSPKPDDSSPVYTFRDSQQFMTTPLTVEKLQSGRGLASATPRLPRNPLATDIGSGGSLMALSQVFRATQAPSSPFVNSLPSGPLSDRPSPNIPIQSRPVQKFTSSPLRTPRSNLHRTHTDPHSYVSIDESQKQRNKIIEERRTRSVENINSDDQSDDEFDRESSFVRRLRLQKKIEQETHARLAAVGRNTPRKVVAGSSMSWTKTASQEPTSPVEGDTQPLASNEGISEEETEQEDNAVAPDSQNRPPISSSEEDKENFIGPSVDDMDTTTSAHDRLSQALHLSPPAVHSFPAEKETLATENSLAVSEQIINVRDSQPSPSQGGPEIQQKSRPPSPDELDEVHSSPDDLQPPAKRPRLQQDTEDESVKHLSQRRSNSPLSIHSTTRSSQNNTNSSAPVPSANTINTTEKPSSMPSLVANTPLNRVDNNTVPETSIPESSPNGSRQEPRPVETANKFSPIPEAEQEDDDLLPTPHHRRDWDKFITRPSPSAVRALTNSASRQKSFFTSSSPMAGKIKSLSEISAEHSPLALADGEMDIEILSAGDKEFSDIVEAFDHQTPTKKRRTNPKSTPLRSEISFSSTSKLDFNKTVSQPVHHEQPNVPESPEQPRVPTVRRKRGRPRKNGNIYEIEETTPTATPKLPKEHSTGKKASTIKAPFTISVTIPVKSQSSQASFASQNSAPGRIERQSRETSVATTAHPLTESETATPKAHTPLPEERIIAPNQVIALWNGQKRAYHPAKFIRPRTHQRCLVKFTDSAPTDVALGHVKKLQLHVGDSVKVDLPDFPKIIHVIQGFSGQLSADELTTEDAPVTDIYGRSTLLLTPKNRKSPRRGHMDSDQTVEVPMHSIYLDMNLWNQLKNRAFTVKTQSMPTKIETPTRGIPTPVSPGSKLSRSDLLTRTGVFAGMVFAVSYGKHDEAKNKITDLISKNGGHILRDGFEELFDFPSSVPNAFKKSEDESADEVQFGLAAGSEEIGFACLIADKHSRRAKYMQALALNVPCLSGRWVEDCVRKNHILDWSCYLLPAGESKFLDGATKSRILTPTPAEQAKFSETIVGRPKILEGQSVLLVMGGGKKAEEKRQAYIFLTYALGAARVERVFDLKAGKAALDAAQTKDGRWDWLYVDDGEEAAATKMIMGTGKGGSVAGQKRKRSSSVFNKSTNDNLDKVRIVSNDFVCQSLILGKIYEP